MSDFTYRVHPEKTIDQFSALDGTVRFYGFVKAILLRTGAKDVLDYGAGRGEFWHDDRSHYRRHMRDLRTHGATVTAADLDPVVLTHPCSHHQVHFDPSKPLPFADNSFDVIVSDATFEHLEEPQKVAAELSRILRPGGYICARTPNQYGYVRLLSSMLPNKLHASALKYVQPGRKAEDVFPTYYRLNSPAAAKRTFPRFLVSHYYENAEPAYYFGNRLLYGVFAALHNVLPNGLSTTILLFIQKPKGGSRLV